MPNNITPPREPASAAAVIAGVLVMALAGCAGPAATGGAGSPEPAESASAPATPVAQSTAPAAAGWLAGSHVTVDSATYDPTTGEVVLQTVVENTANTEAFGADVGQYVLLDTGEGAPTRVSIVSSAAVPESGTSIELTFLLDPETAFDLQDAELVLGGPGYSTWRVPLGDGSVAVGAEPSEHSATGVADAGGLSFTASSVQVLPWACSGVDDHGPAATGRIWFEPGGEEEAAFVIWGDIHESVSIVGGDTPAVVSLTLPDGTVAPMIGTVSTVFDINERIDDFPLCFTVPAPAAGEYVLTWNSYRGASAVLSVTIGD